MCCAGHEGCRGTSAPRSCDSQAIRGGCALAVPRQRQKTLDQRGPASKHAPDRFSGFARAQVRQAPRARLGKCRPCTRPSSPSRACRARRAARQCPLGCGRRTRASARRAVGCGRCGRWCGSVEAWFNFLHGCIIRHRCDEMCRFLWAASASLFVAMPNSLAPLQSHRGSP